MRGVSVVWIAVVIASLGCGTPSGSGDSKRSRKSVATDMTVDGLSKREIDMPGVLFVREDHGIGSYDAFLVPPVSVNYKRKSGRMTEDLEEELKTMLRDSLLQGMTRSEIPVENAPGQCVMQVSLALYNVQVAKRNSAETLGTMTLVMEFRDSTSGQPLLRYAVPNKIERKGSGNRTRQLRQGFDQMVDQLNVGQAMRAAGLDDGEVRPGCTGAMAKATEAGLPAVSGQ